MPWGPSDSVQTAFTVSASNSTIFPGSALTAGGAQVTRAIYVGSTGDLNVRMLSGQTAIFVGVPAGALLPIQVTQVLSTSTSASAILGLY